MRTRSLPALTPDGRAVPVIGLGTWNMELDDPRRVTSAIRRAVELGMTHIDTAELYGHGRVESLVGEAIAGLRDRIYLASKVLPTNASYDGTIAACEASLRRLRCDYLDLYMLHWPGYLALEQTLRAFEALRERGKIRAYGVSNFDVAELDQAVAIVGEGRIACNQVLYHLGQRTIEHTIAPWCRAHGTALVAYSPLGSRGGFPRSRELAAIAERLGATPRQIALAYLTRDELGGFAVVKSSQVSHIEELAAAGDVTLDPAATAMIEAAFPLARWKGLPTL